ncbi:xaa-Arg dipeptidase-like [Clytia hemisphaerica]|uniref:Peptidase M20 domain-containing protein 2 n=1 Tax=Clytia hemisphaerica TaxID=252671 RepID=A0A7M5XHP6_9CNID
MALVETLKKVVDKTIENRKNDLNDISQEIWKNPELSFNEVKAHECLTNFLEKEGFTVSRKTPLETSFVAKYGDCTGGIKVGVICEYDALPKIGHACGHNLIAEAGIGAALALKAAMDSSKDLKINLIVYGTPAEEGGGGKCLMLEKGVFDEADICMMSHPTPVEISTPIWLARIQLDIVFHGKTAHAAAAPWEGINALDAAVACYNNVSMLRQQMKPTNRIHCTIVDGGERPNIIPERAEMCYYVRSLSLKDAEELSERVRACAHGGAQSTGCTVDIKEPAPRYDAVRTNPTMIGLYKKHAQSYGISFEGEDEYAQKLLASTDMGNVSQHRPSIHPCFKIETTAANHTHAFTDATGSQDNQPPTLSSAKSMAMTAIELACDPKLMIKVKEEFEKK